MIGHVLLWSFVTLLRFAQSLAIWWFILSLFGRSFREHKIGFILSSVCMSLIILFYNAIHLKGVFLFFSLEVPFFTIFHCIILKKGLGVAIIETIIGYYLYRITEVEIAIIFDWTHIISVKDAVTKVDLAILLQFIIPFIVVYAFQMLLVWKHWGYYLVNNQIMPNKWQWVVLTFNAGAILYYFKRLCIDIVRYSHYGGWDEQPFLIFFTTLILTILWVINKSEWEKYYINNPSIYLNKNKPLKIKKVENHHH